MISIFEFLNEKLQLNKQSKNFDPNTIKSELDQYKDERITEYNVYHFRNDILNYLCKLAEPKYKVKCNIRQNNAGDFHFFIYKQGEHRYTIGFDGYWQYPGYNVEPKLTFYGCAKEVEAWLYDKK